MMKKRIRPGFTLIELLIAIVIFSGVMILSIATFARSATSSYKVSAVREKTEAARRIVDQISNDFQYIYAPQPKSGDGDVGKFNDSPNHICAPTGNVTVKGFCVDGNNIELLLKYPGDSTFVKKIYRFENIAGADSKITVQEERGCTFNLNADGTTAANRQLQNCIAGTQRDVIDINKYSIDNQTTVFSGVSVVNPTTGALATERAYLQINLKVKPRGVSVTCANLTGDSCYQLKTTVTAGGI